MLTSFMGRSAGKLYTGGGARVSPREQLESELTKVRVGKTEKRYDDALAAVETILARDPNFSDALLLKAQILWEGFADGPAARDTVMKLLHLETDRAGPVYRWAGELYKEIGKNQPRSNDDPP
jgi:tetratricopeptide (TPR) repeat protein